MADTTQGIAADYNGALLGNLGNIDFTHKFEFNLANVAATTGIVGGGVLIIILVAQLVKQKNK